MKILCYVINTCDYCFTTINALVESLRDKIDDKFKNLVNTLFNLRFIMTMYSILLN